MKLRFVMPIFLLMAVQARGIVDVEMDYIAAPGTTWYPGDTLWMGYSLHNKGSDPCPGFAVRIYASTDTNITSSDHELAVYPGGVLASGQTFADAPFVTLPLDLPADDYYIGAVVTAVGDMITSNNRAYDAAPIQVLGNSDLRAVRLGAPVGTMSPGSSFPVALTTRNSGPGDCDGFTARFFASRDIVLTDQDHFLGEHNYGPIASGESSGGSLLVTVQWPADIPTEVSYYIGVIIEYDHDPNLSNNKDLAEFQIFVESRPDINVLDVNAVDGLYQPGDTIALDATIRNDGSDDCPSYTATFYASDDTMITPADHVLATLEGGSLAQGMSDSFAVPGLVPVDLPHGSYTVGVIVRCPADEVTANDVAYDPAVIGVGVFADLRAREIVVSPRVHAPGDGLSIRYEVGNLGPEDCPGYAIDFYISEDTTITESDRLLTLIGQVGDPLSVGHVHISQVNTSIPADTPHGDYFVGMIVTYAEDPEAANNLTVSASRITVGEDARIIDVQLAGDRAIEILWTAPLGRKFTLKRSTNLIDGFPEVVEAGLTSFQAANTVTVNVGGEHRGYFRLEPE